MSHSLKLPPGFTELTVDDTLALKYDGNTTTNEDGTGHTNPYLFSVIRKLFSAPVKRLRPLINKSTKVVILLICGIDETIGIKVRKKAGNTLDFSLSAVLLSLEIQVPKGYTLAIPTEIKYTEELGAHMVLDMAHREEVPAEKRPVEPAKPKPARRRAAAKDPKAAAADSKAVAAVPQAVAADSKAAAAVPQAVAADSKAVAAVPQAGAAAPAAAIPPVPTESKPPA